MAKKTHSSAEQARTAILDAAEQIVIDVGPAGLRISAVAKAAGMAHPNIIHHFGSREGLLEALAARNGEETTARVTAAIQSALAGQGDMLDAVTGVLESAYVGDPGKVAVWMHMSGQRNTLDGNMAQIVEASHQLRQLMDTDVKPDNTKRLVLLVTLALIGDVVYGEALKSAIGFGNEENDRAHFRRWLAGLMLNLSDEDVDKCLDSK